MREKIVLAYSGGLDTSVAIRWLKETKNLDVVTLTVDLGQSENLPAIQEKSGQIGSTNHYTIRAEREFIEDYVFPAVKANALYERKYPISTALARPLIAEKLVETAHKENATTVAHGCTGKGNDQVRFEVAIRSLDPNLKIIAPMREWNPSREEEIRYADKHGIPVPADLD
ncbi:MAG TPA: argininosuccinate synthase domain-containing protein, partial [Candidatus Dormibacteraeota bacterium]|nr:argininosuccinate synthase domain-containing protein [Candidatus Dormibacteraeota bacterium]